MNKVQEFKAVVRRIKQQLEVSLPAEVKQYRKMQTQLNQLRVKA